MAPADLRAWRERRGLSRERAAALLEIPVRTLQEWEQGRRPLPTWLPNYLRLAGAELDAPPSAEGRGGDVTVVHQCGPDCGRTGFTTT